MGSGWPAAVRACTWEGRAGAASALLPASYRRREPEATVLHRVVRGHLGDLLAEARAGSEDGGGLPRYVEQELERYLDCGILANGFARVRCTHCGDELLVAFSCKNRGVCPSCTTRRMHATAADLVDRVLPEAPYRQWVLTFPLRYRLALARDSALLSAALKIFVGILLGHLRRAGRSHGVRGLPAAVTFVQRFGGLCNLNVHFHTLVPDGLFVPRADGPPGFQELPPPTDDEVATLCRRIAARVERRLAARLPPEELAATDALLALQAQAAQLPLFALAAADHQPASERGARRCAACDGFSLHANRRVAAASRLGLEALCRYGARPPIALSRLALLPDGSVEYRLKQPLRDGRRALVFPPVAFLARLAALVPPPRSHLVRYHGALAPRSKARAALVPLRPKVSAPGQPAPTAGTGHRIPWADLLRRVYAVDVLRCPRCDGRRTVLAFITEPAVVEKILIHLGLPAEPPPRSPARPPARPPPVDPCWDAP